MNLINSYVAEVGKHLPLLKGREDIEKELKSTLEDMLEDRATTTGRLRDEAMETELLKEYGSPQKVAATYNPHPYLIGPRAFPFFIMILRITIFGITVGLSVVTILQIVTQLPMMTDEMLRLIGKGISGIISTSISAFGYVVLAFVMIERFVPSFTLKMDEEEWDPASLTKEPEPDAIKRGELIGQIVFSFIALAILNLYSQLFGMFFVVNGHQSYIPIFSEVFFKFIPWINLILLAKIALGFYLLRETTWSNIARIGKILIDAANLGLTVAIFRTPGILGFTAESFIGSPFTPEEAKTFIDMFTLFFPIALMIAIIVQGIELAKNFFELFKINYRMK